VKVLGCRPHDGRRQFGCDAEDWAALPVIGIINTRSEINACHAHLRTGAENVKRGILQAGGFPIELPAMSLAEPFVPASHYVRGYGVTFSTHIRLADELRLPRWQAARSPSRRFTERARSG
jgi:hypothetical protein